MYFEKNRSIERKYKPHKRIDVKEKKRKKECFLCLEYNGGGGCKFQW